jgi:hypothetical protein
MRKRRADRVLYSITVSLDAGFGKEVLDHRDIEAIASRADFARDD